MLAQRVRTISKIGCRSFSDRPKITVYKTGILRHINVKEKLYKASLKKLTVKLMIDIDEKELSAEVDANPLQYDYDYFVGDFSRNPLEYAHSNMSKYHKEHLATARALHRWKVDKETKQTLGINITSTVDYHPFPMTFGTKNISTKRLNLSKWKVMKNHKYADLIDSIGDNMPLLSRTCSKKNQKLLIWRDIHDDINTIPKIKNVIEQFQPDSMVLEYPCEGSDLDQYISYRAKLKSAISRYRQFIMRDKISSKSRGRWARIFGMTSSFAVDRSIMLAIEKNIPIVLADYSSGTRNLLYSGSNALDMYPLVLWAFIGFPMKEFGKFREISDSLLKFTYMNMKPHFHVICSYRNDLMSLAINENKEKKILFVTGAAHSKDIVDRLCGDVKISNPFKEISEKRVLLRDLVAFDFVGDIAPELSKDDIQFVREKFGDEAARLMLLTNEERNEELWTNMLPLLEKSDIPKEEFEKLKRDYGKTRKRNKKK